MRRTSCKHSDFRPRTLRRPYFAVRSSLACDVRICMENKNDPYMGVLIKVIQRPNRIHSSLVEDQAATSIRNEVSLPRCPKLLLIYRLNCPYSHHFKDLWT